MALAIRSWIPFIELSLTSSSPRGLWYKLPSAAIPASHAVGLALKLFLSYASEQRTIAEEIAVALREEGHDVFFDRTDLPGGAAYDSTIRAQIESSELMVFLVSPESLTPGRYTLSEIKFAEERWPSPSGHLLPVLAARVEKDAIPPYLRAVTILRPSGSLAAEVAAAVARLARPRWFGVRRAGAIGVALLVLIAASFGAWQWYGSARRCADADQRVQQAELQRGSGDYASAWDRYGEALALCPGSESVRSGRARMAMDWLRNIRVREGKQTFTDIVMKVQPALAEAAVQKNDQLASDALAHLGWGDFLRSRDDFAGADPVSYYRKALERDPKNPFAHAMWGHFILWNSGRLADAEAHFAAAVESGREHGYVRSLEITAHLLYDDQAVQNELVRALSDMRRHSEPLPAESRDDSKLSRIWDVYRRRLLDGDDRSSFLSSLPPEDHLELYGWLFPAKEIPDSRRIPSTFILAQLQENAGRATDALASYQSALGAIVANHGSSGFYGLTKERVDTAIRRLSRK